MNEQDFLARTKTFGLRVIRAFRSLPKSYESQMMGRQMLRFGTSVGANYRAACRARSRADIIAKLKIVEDESDESAYWMELLVQGGCVTDHRMADLLKEVNELTAMTVASIKTLRKGDDVKKAVEPRKS